MAISKDLIFIQSALMAFTSFLGRVLFAFVFILSAWQEYQDYGVDGGSAAKSLSPKFHIFSKHFTTHTGLSLSDLQIKSVVAAGIGMKGIGGLLFIFGTKLGAILMLLYITFITPIIYDFYNYDADKDEFDQLFVMFAQNLAMIGALFYFIGMKNSMPRRPLKKKAVPKIKTS